MRNSKQQEKMHSLVAKWQTSSQNQLAFANEHEISIHTLKYCIYKIRKQNKSPSSFIQIDQISAPEICLMYPNGVELLIPAQTSISSSINYPEAEPLRY